MEMRESIRGYIVENSLLGDDSPLVSDNISLLDNGIIDSVGNDEELVPENLDSIDNLVGFVSRKRTMV